MRSAASFIPAGAGSGRFGGIVLAVFLAVAPALAGGCGVRSNLKPGVGVVPYADSAVLLVGVKQGHTLWIAEGTIDDRLWKNRWFGGFYASVTPDKDGYLVIKAPPLTGMTAAALTRVTIDDVGSPPRFYPACTGNMTIAFQAEPGTVTYVGDIVVEREFGGGRISYHLENQEEEARAYVARKYPGLLPAFVRRDAPVRRISFLPCRSNIPMIITIPI